MMLGQGTWEKAYQGEEPGKRIQTSPGTTGVKKTYTHPDMKILL
jgi:hypothetical protein